MKISHKLLISITAIVIGAFVGLYFITYKSVGDILILSRQNNLSGVFKIKAIIFTDEELSQNEVGTSTMLKFGEFLKVDPSIFRIKIWDKNLKIIYSDAANLIGLGTDKSLDQVKSSFLENSQIKWSVSDNLDLSTPEGNFGPFIMATVPIKGNNGQVYWVAEIYSSTALFLSELDKFIIQSGAIFSFVLILIIIVTYLILSKFILRPVRLLTKSVEIIGSGNLGEKAEIKSKDELGQLAQAFNKMATRLKESYAGLEEKVREKTAALQESNRGLENTKTAILNVTEDLEREKEKVEVEVVARTRDLKEEQARLVASVNSLSLGFAIFDTQHALLLNNKTLTTVLDLDDTKISSNMIIEKCATLCDFKKEAERCMTEERLVDIKDIFFRNKFLRGLFTPIIMIRDHEEVIGYTFLVEDITEVKVLERSREEFFSIASHELRTPLTAIRGNASLIQEFYAEKINDKDVMEMVADMHEASVRLISIVNDFLDVSRLEQKKVEFKKQELSMSEIFKEVIREIGKIASDRNLYLRIKEDEVALPGVLADRGKVKQILINLIGNAINYTERGGVEIWAKPEGKYLKVFVSDTGAGIPPAGQTMLFRKFQQAGESTITRSVSKGTGLGLYISKLLAYGMGGTIELVESKEGVGSTFSFALPLFS